MVDDAMTKPPLLGTRRFAPLFWVQALGAFNDQVFKTGFLVLLTYRLAAEMGLNASMHNAIAGALFIIPFALVAPTAGMLADGVDKARMMRVIKALEIVLMIVGAVAFHIQNLALLYFLLFLMGAQSALFAPIKYGVLPQYLTPSELARGNGMIQAATFLAILLGQIAGAKLVLTSYGVTAISVGVISVAILGFVASLFAPPAPPVGTPPKVDWVLPRAMWAVVRDGRKVPGAFRAILGIAWFWFTGAAFLALLPPYALEGLHGTDGVFVLLLSTFSVGVAIGALFCARIFGERPAVPMASWGAGGIALASVALWPATGFWRAGVDFAGPLVGFGGFLGDPRSWPVLGCFAVLAACSGLYVTPLNVVLQVETPPEARGRFIACSNTVDALAMAGSALLAAVLVGAGLRQWDVYALVGATGFLAALWAIRQGR